jgi:hypothetical protein
MPSKSRRLGNRRPLKEKELRIASLANEILGRAQLPCKVVFSKYDTRVNASHVWFKSGRCYLVINSYADIGVPQHVILHEAAHHGQKSGKESHGPEWANRLLQLYKQTGISLPSATKFESFAKLCDLAIRRTS